MHRLNEIATTVLDGLDFNRSTVLCLCVLKLVLFYHHLTKNTDFWAKRGVPGPRPHPLFGNYKDNILGRIQATELTRKLYDDYPGEKMIGVFVMSSPVLIIRDPDLVHAVLARDFFAFPDRGIRVYEAVEPLSQHFFNLPRSSWLPLRRRLMPAFSVSQIKQKFGSMVAVAERFVGYVGGRAGVSCELECAALVAKFMTEVIGEYGFELRMNEFDGESGASEFQMMVRRRGASNWLNYVRRFLREHWSGLYKYCFHVFHNEGLTEYFVRLVGNVFEFRRRAGIRRNDYAGRLMDLKDRGEEIEFTDKMIAAQAYVFFTAGADTTAITVSNALYEIAVNPAVQQTLRHEIEQVLVNGAPLTLDSMRRMEYLNLVLKETLRKYALRNITRKTSREYTLPGTNVTIPKDTQILVPQYAIQNDWLTYPRPDLFDPERFRRSNDADPKGYLPFGKGPRKCIGELFSCVVSKIAIVSVVRNFNLEPGAIGRGANDPRKVLLFPKNGIKLKFTKIT